MINFSCSLSLQALASMKTKIILLMPFPGSSHCPQGFLPKLFQLLQFLALSQHFWQSMYWERCSVYRASTSVCVCVFVCVGVCVCVVNASRPASLVVQQFRESPREFAKRRTRTSLSCFYEAISALERLH